MKENYSSTTGRRGKRGGQRRRGRNEGGRDSRSSSYNSGYQSEDRPSRAPKKLTFWQKIVAFFTGGSNAAKPHAKRSSSSSSTSTSTVTRTSTGPSTSSRRENPRFADESAPRTSEPREPHESREPRGSRKAEALEVTTPKLYVGNLSYDATESDLFDLFQGVGAVQNAEIVSHKATMKSKGFGFVTMATTDEAKRAVEILHDKEFMGRKMFVSGSKSTDRPASSTRAEREEAANEASETASTEAHEEAHEEVPQDEEQISLADRPQIVA